MLSRLEPKHWTLIFGFLASTLTVVAGLDHWVDLEKPAVFAGIGFQFVTMLGAIFAGAPPNPNWSPDAHPARRATDPDKPDTLGTVTETTRRNLL